MYFSTRREDSRPRESGVLRKIEDEVSQCLGYGQRPQLRILYRAHSWIVYKCLYFRLNLMAVNTE